MKTLIKNTILFSVILFLNSKIFADDLRTLHEKSFSVKSNSKIIVDASAANINIQGWDKDEAYIKITGNDKAEEKMRFKIDQSGDEVHVYAKKKNSFFSWFTNLRLKIEIMVPKKFNAKLETSGGDIMLSNISGSQKLETSGGDIILENTSGKVDCGTSGGDIRLTNHSGATILETSGGDIEVFESTGNLRAETSGGDILIKLKDEQIFAETSGGDIDITYSGQNKGIKAETSGGDIRVKVPSDFAANAYLDTSGGSVNVNIKTSSVDVKKRSEFRGQLNGGGQSVNLETSGGNITLE